MDSTRAIFFGSADLAATILDRLGQSSVVHLIAAVSQPDKPRGRDLKLQPTPVKVVAVKLGLPILQPERARRPEFIDQLRELAPDLIIVAAYGQILPQSILDIPRHGCLNVHTSLLPQYRGAAPIQWAILNGEEQSGVTIMKMDAGMDTGPIVSQAATPIEPQDTGQTLHDRLALLGAELLIKTIPEYLAGRVVPHPQPAAGVSYAPKISKENGRLDWRAEARSISNRIRAFNPWPGAFTHLASPFPLTQGEGASSKDSRPMLVKIWSAKVMEGGSSGIPGEILTVEKNGLVVSCGSGALRILRLQREGGRVLKTEEFLSGFPLRAGQRFESPL